MSRRPEAKPATPAAPTSRVWWLAGVVVLAGLLFYSNSLSNPFVLDDHDSIGSNAAIRDWSNLERVFAQRRNTPLAGRPVAALSFALNFASSGLAVQAYHATNIAVHVSCGLLLFGIVRRTLRLPRLAKEFAGAADHLALATALVWTVHPLNSEVVDYVTQRTESMMAMFLLITLYASIRSVASRRAAAWQVLAVSSCGLGMLCKESMVVAPVIVVLYDRIFVFDSMLATIRARWRLYGGLALAWLLLAWAMLPGPRSNSVGVSAGVRPWTYLLNQSVMIARYLRLAAWPTDLVVLYGPPLSLGLRDVWPQALVVVALMAATLAALRRSPVAGFLGAWVLITLAPTSTIVPIATEVGAERRMYLPLMAIVALIVIGAYRLDVFRRRFTQAAALSVLAAVSLALGAATLLRNREYESGLALAEVTLRRWPTDVSHGMMGTELAFLHRDVEAIVHLRQAAPTDPRSRYNLGVSLFNLKRYDEAVQELRILAREHPMREEIPMAHRIMGHAFALQRNWSAAIAELRQTLSMTPFDADARQLLADVSNDQGLALLDAGRIGEAVAAFRRAVELDSNNGSFRQNLAAALYDNHDAVAAEAEARNAIAVNPADAASYQLLGRALAVQGKISEAIAQFQRALELSPDDAQIKDDLNRVR